MPLQHRATQTVLAVKQDLGDKPNATFLRWGLIPSWAKDKKIGASLNNARSDGVASKPSFRAAFKRRRCLILADGFYEWKKGTDSQATLPYSHGRWRPVRLCRPVGALVRRRAGHPELHDNEVCKPRARGRGLCASVRNPEADFAQKTNAVDPISARKVQSQFALDVREQSTQPLPMRVARDQ